MLKAIDSTTKNGIIISPCGSGKTLVMISAAMKAGHLNLILCYERLGVDQVAKALGDHTTLLGGQICVYSGKRKDNTNPYVCFLVTTYGTLAMLKEKKNKSAQSLEHFVYNTKWDLVCCDEVHHSCAKTYRPMIETLSKSAKRVLGFTATLFRNEYCDFKSQDRFVHEIETFGWFGEVIFRRSCRQLEDAGLIAKIRRSSITVKMTPEFKKAHCMALGSQMKYIASLNPRKLEALVVICAMHKKWGHAGMVFANHLVSAKVAKECLGEGWEILSGGSAHGEEELHSAEKNATIVKRFNNGELHGLICTAVGESSMDIFLKNFTYAIHFDGNGGISSAAQKIGRLSRTTQLSSLPGETVADLTKRRLEEQKYAAYYDLNTDETEDMDAAKKRQIVFAAEGYGESVTITQEQIAEQAKELNVQLPYNSLLEEMKLLKEVLQYRSLGDVCVAAKVAATEHKVPQRLIVKERIEKSKSSSSKIVRDMHKVKLAKARKVQKDINKRAITETRETIENAEICEKSRIIFRALGLPPDVIAAVGLHDANPLPTI